MVESEHIRWVRYAADCAERVLPLTGTVRPQADAAIRAARVWADEPTEAHRLAAIAAAHDTLDAYDPTCIPAYVAYPAIAAIRDAALTVTYVKSTSYAARVVAARAVEATSRAARAAPPTVADDIETKARERERVWQTARRWYYGLPKEG